MPAHNVQLIDLSNHNEPVHQVKGFVEKYGDRITVRTPNLVDNLLIKTGAPFTVVNQ